MSKLFVGIGDDAQNNADAYAAKEEKKGLMTERVALFQQVAEGEFEEYGLHVVSKRMYSRTFAGTNSGKEAEAWAKDIESASVIPLFDSKGKAAGHLVQWS